MQTNHLIKKSANENLPYAIALNVENEWGEKFEAVLEKQELVVMDILLHGIMVLQQNCWEQVRFQQVLGAV